LSHHESCPISPLTENQEVIEDDESERDDEEGEEGRKVEVKRLSERPSQGEVDEHNTNHIPFRSWCKHCVKGKAVNQSHKRAKGTEQECEVPVISIDYAYVNEDREIRNKRAKECQ
jgi:hypothetical protein